MEIFYIIITIFSQPEKETKYLRIFFSSTLLCIQTQLLLFNNNKSFYHIALTFDLIQFDIDVFFVSLEIDDDEEDALSTIPALLK